MMKWFSLPKLGLSFLLLGATLVAGADDVKLDWLSSGVSKKIGYYRPLKLVLSADKPAGIKVAPADLTAPLYGEFQLGPPDAPTPFFVIVDEPEGKPSRLFVDANANGDLTDDPPTTWKGENEKTEDGKVLTSYNGGADLQLAYGSEKETLHLGIYRFDKHDSRRPALADKLLYYRDYGRAGDVSLGGQTYHAILNDDEATGNFAPAKDDTHAAVSLLLDLNNDGKFTHEESFDVTKPFNIGGTTYEIAGLTPSGGTFQFVKSTNTVAETKPRPTLAAGARAVTFEATNTDGAVIHFPESYKGKLVMLDFWATWCPPCRAEIPHIASAYEKYHTKGFEVLGVSLDRPNDSDKLAAFTKEHHMPWPQIYSTNGQSAVAKAYYIDFIPHAFLVDGDTGMIVAEGDGIHGESLAPAIEKALAKHTN